MKKDIKVITLTAIITCLSIVALRSVQLVPINLVWNNGYGQDLYELRASNDVSGSWSNWPVVAVITNKAQTNIVLNVVPGQMFYVLVSSNFWGYAGISNITNTPVLPLPAHVEITR